MTTPTLIMHPESRASILIFRIPKPVLCDLILSSLALCPAALLYCTINFLPAYLPLYTHSRHEPFLKFLKNLTAHTPASVPPCQKDASHERTDMAFTVSIISRSVISPGLLVMCENMSNCRRSTYHRQSLGSWLVL